MIPARPFTPDSLAERWGVSAETVRHLVKRGDLPGFRVGRMIRIPVGAVEEYERCETHSRTTAGGFCVTWPDPSIASGRRRYALEAITREAAARRGASIDQSSPAAGRATVGEVWEAYRRDKAGRPIAKAMKYTGKAVLLHFGAMGPLRSARGLRAYTAARRAAANDGAIWTELGHLRAALVWAAEPGQAG